MEGRGNGNAAERPTHANSQLPVRDVLPDVETVEDASGRQWHSEMPSRPRRASRRHVHTTMTTNDEVSNAPPLLSSASPRLLTSPRFGGMRGRMNGEEELSANRPWQRAGSTSSPTFSPREDSHIGFGGISSQEVLARFHQSIMLRDAMVASGRTAFSDDQGTDGEGSSSPKKTNSLVNSSPVQLAAAGAFVSLSQAQNINPDRNSPPSATPFITSVRVDLESSSPLRNIGLSPMTFSLGRRFAHSVTPKENGTTSFLTRDELETGVLAYTLKRYILRRPKPSVPARPMYRSLYVIFIALVLVPFGLIALLFGLHYWASRKIVSDVYNHAYRSADNPDICVAQFHTLRYGKVGSMSKDAFICMLGILLDFFIIVIGGLFFLWAVPWRYVFSNYLQTLTFIRGSATKLSRIESIRSVELPKSPKPVSSSLWWHTKCLGRSKEEEKSSQRVTVIEGIVEKVLLLGNTLNECMRYIPSKGGTELISAIAVSINAEASMSAVSPERQSDCVSLRSRRTVPDCISGDPASEEQTFGNVLNPPHLHICMPSSPTSMHPPHSGRREMLAGATADHRRRNLSGNFCDVIHALGGVQGGKDLSISLPPPPSRRRFVHVTETTSSNLNASSWTNIPFFTESIRISQSLGATNNRERLSTETNETKMEMINDYGCVLQQVTFLVCRLFLPKLETNSDGYITQSSCKQVQEMSRQFLRIVLRVSKEESGLPFNICLDSVIVSFYIPSGPNSVNLIQPRNCAFRLVSELSKLEMEWKTFSPVPFLWGITMHISPLMIGIGNTSSRHFMILYSEEIKFIYRVTELCHILHCPLIMLQSCYNVFRVCMTAIPIDVIYQRTLLGKIRIYIYEPKSVMEWENINSKREYYKPFLEAFHLFCEKKFHDAALLWKDILELDHNVRRLYQLCVHFAQLEKDGSIHDVLSSDDKYVREGPNWDPLENKIFNFLRESTLLPTRKEGEEEEEEKKITSPHPHRWIPRPHPNNSSGSHCNNHYEDDHSTGASLLPDAVIEDEAESIISHPSLQNQTSAMTIPPSFLKEGSFAINDGESPQPMFSRQLRVLEADEATEISVYYSPRAVPMPTVLSDGELDLNINQQHLMEINESSTFSKNYDDDTAHKTQFDIYEPLGYGSFSIVYRGLHPNGNMVAIKKYAIGDRDENNSWIQSARSEIEMLSSCHHENIVRYIQSCFQDGYLFIITEFVSGGSLSTLVKTFQSLPSDTIRRYAGDILRGLQYLHDRQITHRDISPHNVLVNIDGVCKLSDFGGAVQYALQTTDLVDREASMRDMGDAFAQTNVLPTPDNLEATMGTVILKNCFGTPVCMPPEGCQGIVHPKNDIWALGITLCYCFSGKFPWPDEELGDVKKLINKIRLGLITPQVPYDMMDSNAADFINRCLQRDASCRPSAAELLFHPFMVS